MVYRKMKPEPKLLFIVEAEVAMASKAGADAATYTLSPMTPRILPAPIVALPAHPKAMAQAAEPRLVFLTAAA